MSKQPPDSWTHPRGPKWKKWTLEQARRAEQLELFVQRSTKPRTEPPSPPSNRKTRMGVFRP